jgi:8-oxo-dGTP pyrophosphatase MutT (NUDIX family)
MDSERPVTEEQLDAGPPAIARQAAAVILLRDAREGFELLLVRRNPAQRFMGGFWVFPGGAVEAHEGKGDAAHRAAAVRELREEAGVGGIEAEALAKYSRWITPEALAIRFDTHFYLARAPAGVDARCDGRECVALRWDAPRAVLAAHRRGELALAFPTLRQLEQLSRFATADELVAYARTHDVRPLHPLGVGSGEVARLVLPGESGAGDDPDAPGRP